MHAHRLLRRPGRLAALAALFVGAGCGPGTPAEQRADRIANGTGDLLIGAAWPWAGRTEGHYLEGLRMGIDEVNAAGGVSGRQLRLVQEDDGESVSGGRLAAQRLAADPDVVAVVGHLHSFVSIPAADIYERGGVLMLAPASTSPGLTRRGYRHVFRTVNDDEQIGGQMAAFAERRGYRRVLVVYVDNAYGQGLANAFERAAAGGVKVVGREAYSNGTADFGRTLGPLLREKGVGGFNAVFLAGTPPEAGRVVAAIRRAGIGVPIFGGEALDTAETIEAAGEAAEGLVVASVFHPDDPHAEATAFRAAYERKYGHAPDSWAARGYEAVHVLAQGMRAAGTADPARVSAAFRAGAAWNGVTGPFRFDDKGDVVGKRLVAVVVRDGRFAYLDDTPLTARGGAAAQAVPARAVSSAR